MKGLTSELIHSIFHSMKIEELLKQQEGKCLEFKENISSKQGVLASIIAFSNTAGGKLVIGINDKSHAVVGIAEPHLIEEKLSNIISDSITPRIVPNIEIIPWRDTYVIIVDVVPGYNRPYCLKSKGIKESTYVRVGSSNRLADQELINVIKRSLVSKTFDEEVMYELSSEDIDFRVVSDLFKEHRILQDKDYYNLGICLKEQNKTLPTIGGIILFGKHKEKYFPDAWIQLGCFRGIDKSVILDSKELTENFPAAIEQAINFVHNHIFSAIKINDIRHEKEWSIPKIALREAIINAIVHADYSLKGAPIRISVFDDRVEIENPGLLSLGLTINDIIEGISKIRNRVIARVFHELKLIEKWGSGIQRIISSCKEVGLLEPKFEEIGIRFRVTLYRKKVHQVLLDKTEEQIIAMLSADGYLSTKEIAIKMNLSTRTIRNHLIKMIEKQKIYEISRGTNDPKKKYGVVNR